MFLRLILEVTPWSPSTGDTPGSKNQRNCNSLQFQPKSTKTTYITITNTATSKGTLPDRCSKKDSLGLATDNHIGRFNLGGYDSKKMLQGISDMKVGIGLGQGRTNPYQNQFRSKTR
jgi:hypothetical protein